MTCSQIPFDISSIQMGLFLHIQQEGATSLDANG